MLHSPAKATAPYLTGPLPQTCRSAWRRAVVAVQLPHWRVILTEPTRSSFADNRNPPSPLYKRPSTTFCLPRHLPDVAILAFTCRTPRYIVKITTSSSSRSLHIASCSYREITHHPSRTPLTQQNENGLCTISVLTSGSFAAVLPASRWPSFPARLPRPPPLQPAPADLSDQPAAPAAPTTSAQMVRRHALAKLLPAGC